MAKTDGVRAWQQNTVSVVTTPGKLRQIAAAMEVVWQESQPGGSLVAYVHNADKLGLAVRFVVDQELMQLELSTPTAVRG